MSRQRPNNTAAAAMNARPAGRQPAPGSTRPRHVLYPPPRPSSASAGCADRQRSRPPPTDRRSADSARDSRSTVFDVEWTRQSRMAHSLSAPLARGTRRVLTPAVVYRTGGRNRYHAAGVLGRAATMQPGCCGGSVMPSRGQQLYDNMTSSTKPEVHSMLQRRQMRTKPRP